MSTPDPLVDDVREARHRISERFGHDPVRLLEYYMEFQEQYRDRLVTAPELPDVDKPAA